MQIPLWLEHGIIAYGYWAVLVAVLLESMGVPFPGETALLAGAIYAGTTGHLDIALVIAAAATGAIVGDNIGFGIGHYGGYPLLVRATRLLRIDERAVKYAQLYFERHGNKTVFLGRFFSLLRTYVALLAGINRMSWRSFLFWNAAGGVVWAVVFGLLGFILGKNLPLLGMVLRIIGTGGVVALALFALVVGGLWYRRRQRARVEMERVGAGDEAGEADMRDGQDM